VESQSCIFFCPNLFFSSFFYFFASSSIDSVEAIIESTVAGNSSASVPTNKDEFLSDQSQIYLPINNPLSEIGHVAGFIKELGQGKIPVFEEWSLLSFFIGVFIVHPQFTLKVFNTLPIALIVW
jgi:hypothetical protein